MSEPRLTDPNALRLILENGIKELGGTYRFDLAHALDDLVHADLMPLWAIAGLAALAMFAVDSDLARTKVPFLRPAYIETIRQLGIIAHEGQKLAGRLNQYQALQEDEIARLFWENEVQRWTDWADRIISWRLPHLRHAFANEADRSETDYVGTPWQHHSATWLQVRMKRLNEWLLSAAQLQHATARKPSEAERAIPDWGTPPAPVGQSSSAHPDTPVPDARAEVESLFAARQLTTGRGTAARAHGPAATTH